MSLVWFLFMIQIGAVGLIYDIVLREVMARIALWSRPVIS